MALEQQTVNFTVREGDAAMDAALLETMRRTMKGWKLVGFALTFERKVTVEVAARRDPDVPPQPTR